MARVRATDSVQVGSTPAANASPRFTCCGASDRKMTVASSTALNRSVRVSFPADNGNLSRPPDLVAFLRRTDTCLRQTPSVADDHVATAGRPEKPLFVRSRDLGDRRLFDHYPAVSRAALHGPTH